MKRKLVTLLTIVCMLCTMSVPVFGAENSDASKLSNPRVTSARPATWDCVWFGSYPQSLDGKGGYNGDPIKWRVLSVEGDEALLLADKNLDVKKYNEAFSKVTWETSTIRSWLNGYGSNDNQDGEDYTTDNFIDQAFTPEEQEAIDQKTVENLDNQEYGVEAGSSTEDKIFLISMSDALNPSYGFLCDYDNNSKTRVAKNTAYAESKPKTYGNWWLRSPGGDDFLASHVSDSGTIGRYGRIVGGTGYAAIRPALRINLQSDLWDYAGTVCSDGSTDEVEKGTGDMSVTIKPPIEPQALSATWDCVWFGHYLQGFDGNDGFKKEPIKWRVLSVVGDEALLLADKTLDAKPYNETKNSVTWAASTVRSWLNGYGSNDNQDGNDYTVDNFINQAFTSEEQNAICRKSIEAAESSEPEAEGEDLIEDKIFLLSREEAQTPAYGFPDDYSDETRTRRTEATPYIKHITHNSPLESWWLRPSNHDSNDAADVSKGVVGSVYGHVDLRGGIRPVLYLNLKSDLWTYAGTISSDGLLERIDAEKTKVEYKVNENLNLDDLSVTALYIDTTQKEVTNYTTNAADINMATPGDKKLVVTYTEDSITQTDSIEITVEQESITRVPTPSNPGTGQDSTSTTPAQGNGDGSKPIVGTQSNKKQTNPAATVKKPKKVSLKKVSSTKKGALKLTWKRDKTATGYQAVIATDKKFKKNKKIATIKKNKTVTKTFTKLKSKKTYFAKARAYKQVGKTKVYGSYSKVKKAKVK